jgi:hypothetical protein
MALSRVISVPWFMASSKGSKNDITLSKGLNKIFFLKKELNYKKSGRTTELWPGPLVELRPAHRELLFFQPAVSLIPCCMWDTNFASILPAPIQILRSRSWRHQVLVWFLRGYQKTRQHISSFSHLFDFPSEADQREKLVIKSFNH